MAELITVGLAANWIPKLIGALAKIRGDRRREIDAIVNDFGVDPDLLAKYYIEPKCQPNNPADQHEEGPIRS